MRVAEEQGEIGPLGGGGGQEGFDGEGVETLVVVDEL